MMRRAIIGVGVALVSGCGLASSVSDRIGLGGGTVRELDQPYKATLSRGDDLRTFSVLVRAGGASLELARESARFPATRYCLEHFGASDIAWDIDTATGDWAMIVDDKGDITVAGRCTAR